MAHHKESQMTKIVSDKACRAQARRKIGRLQTARLTPSTIIKYCTNLLFFLDWIENNIGYLPAEAHDLSECLCEFGEFCWAEGEGISRFADVLSALPHVMKNIRGKFKDAWVLVDTWRMNEIPSRATPFSTKVLFALLGKCILDDDWIFAAGLLLAFQGMLRPCELLNLRVGDISLTKCRRNIIVNLGLTKGGRRKGAEETVILDDRALWSLLCLVNIKRKPGDRFLDLKSYVFRRRFAELLSYCGLDDLGYMPYSLRRCGATTLFRDTANLDLVMVRGRWQSQRTARIYVNDGMAAEKEEHFSDATDSELASLGELTGLALNTLCPRSGGSSQVCGLRILGAAVR